MPATCPSGKVSFPTRRAAKQYASKRKWWTLRIYRCPQGDHWHHTSYGAREAAWSRENR